MFIYDSEVFRLNHGKIERNPPQKKSWAHTMTRVFTFVNCSLSSATLQIAVQASIQPAISLSRIHWGVFPIKMPTGPVENYPPWNSQPVHPWKIGQAPKGQDCLESIHFSGVNSLLVLGSVCTSCSQIRIISHHVVLLGTCHQPTASPIACLYIWTKNCIVSCYILCITRCYMLASYGIHGIVNHHIISSVISHSDISFLS